MHNTDYYALLGVDHSSPPEEITRAYRRLARQYHPDVNPEDREAGERFHEINEAYQVLSDPEKRAQYNLHLASILPAQNSVPSPTGAPQVGQQVPGQQPTSVDLKDIEEAVGDLAAMVEAMANETANELREALRDFGANLDSISQTFGGGDAARDRLRRQGFPPPPVHGKPPRGGRPPWNGKAPKP